MAARFQDSPSKHGQQLLDDAGNVSQPWARFFELIPDAITQPGAQTTSAVASDLCQ